MIAAGEGESPAAIKGVKWLCEKQLADGTWDEKITTGTGFPSVFYIRYDMYRNYFPLLALGTFTQVVTSCARSDSVPRAIRLTAAERATSTTGDGTATKAQRAQVYVTRRSRDVT